MEFSVNGQSTYIYSGARAFDASLPSVLFIHGAGLDHTVWILQSRWFAHHGYNALAVDLPGHGRSHGSALDSIDKMAAWVWDCMDALNVPHAHLVGHSMGALVALAAAASAPERARFTGLLGIAVPMPVSEPLLKSAKENSPDAIEMLNLWGFGASAHLGGNATPGMWMLGGGKRLMERAAPGVIYTDLNACNQYLDGLQDAGSVACHALLILGQKDLMTPLRAAQALADALVDSETVVLEKSGHAMLSERPEQVLDQLIRIV